MVVRNRMIQIKFVRNSIIQIKLNTSTGTFYDEEISENPSCSCSYFSNPRKTKYVCIYIVWILLNKFGLKENNRILAQVSYFKYVLANIFAQVGNTPSSSSARNCAETVPFRKISTPGNQVKLRYFSQF